MPPNGVGGGGVHWNAETWRFLPSDFVLRTHLTERYGESFIPEDMTIQDWGVTFEDLEPHYDAVESMIGTAPYPYADTVKTNALREAAEGAGLTVSLPPLAVSFAPWPRTRRTTSSRCAPSAKRMPNSRVRCVTVKATRP